MRNAEFGVRSDAENVADWHPTPPSELRIPHSEPPRSIKEHTMHPRDRIKELRRVRAAELRPNPRNWRTHPREQQDALRGILAEIGYADALLARELEDGSLQLVDGHLRAETTPEMEVPVLVLDLTAEEADKLLAVLDPLAGLAGRDQGLLDDLLADIETDSAAVRALLDRLAASSEPALPKPPEVSLHEAWQVVVECADEEQQRDLYQRLTAEGLKCRVLTL
jgi:hypothetical protein